MKVTALFEYPTLNGGERSLLTVIRALQDAHVQYTAIAPAQGALAETLHELEIPVTGLPEVRGADRQQRIREFLDGALAKLRPTLVHANSLAMSRMMGPVTHGRRLPSVGHLRDILRLSGRAVADLNQVTRLVAVSKAVRDHHASQSVDLDRIVVIRNGIDLTEFAPAPSTGYLHALLRLPSDTQLLCGIGQLGMRKGWDVLVRALRGVVKKHPTAHLLIIGEQSSRKVEADDYVSSLREMASHHTVDGHVHFLGRRRDVSKLLHEITVLVHPARQEPLGRVLLEAAASSVPVVATNVGGTEEIFGSDGAAARLVAADDELALQTAMIEALADEALRQQMADAARCRMESCFSAGRCAEANMVPVPKPCRLTASRSSNALWRFYTAVGEVLFWFCLPGDVSYGLTNWHWRCQLPFSHVKSDTGYKQMQKKLYERIDELFADTDDCLKAQLCLFTYRAQPKDCDGLSDEELNSLCKQLRIKLEHTSDQYAAVTCELQEMAESDPSKFGRDQIWTMLRTIKIQDQLLKLHIGGEPLNV